MERKEVEEKEYFEDLCKDVYGYYGMLRKVDPRKHALVMLRSMGEFWTEKEVDEFFSNKQDDSEFLNFTDFRRLAKGKWYDPEEDQKENGRENDDGYGNQVYMHAEDARRMEEAFNGVSEFYTGNRGPHKTVPSEVLFNILTNFEDPIPENVADYLVSSLHVYNNSVTARALLCLLGRREKIQQIF